MQSLMQNHDKEDRKQTPPGRGPGQREEVQRHHTGWPRDLSNMVEQGHFNPMKDMPLISHNDWREDALQRYKSILNEGSMRGVFEDVPRRGDLPVRGLLPRVRPSPTCLLSATSGSGSKWPIVTMAREKHLAVARPTMTRRRRPHPPSCRALTPKRLDASIPRTRLRLVPYLTDITYYPGASAKKRR